MQDFRSDSNTSSGDVDFREQPPIESSTDDTDKSTKALEPPPTPPSIPLEPPPPHNMEEFLKNAGQQVFRVISVFKVLVVAVENYNYNFFVYLSSSIKI